MKINLIRLQRFRPREVRVKWVAVGCFLNLRLEKDKKASGFITTPFLAKNRKTDNLEISMFRRQ